VRWGKQAEASKVLEEMNELSKTRYVSPFDFATIHFGFGNSDVAFEWLERACKARCYELVFFKVDPRFDPVRSDLRLRRLLKRPGL
jgi:hypothetical protein